MTPASVYLARHGQTAYNHEGRFQGQQAIPLDETGRAQALELAERAADHGFRALWCSPLLRARETADAVAARIGLEPRDDARFMETDAGDWTDRSFAEIHALAPEQFAAFVAADPDFAFPGGESFAEQEERVHAALADVEASRAAGARGLPRHGDPGGVRRRAPVTASSASSACPTPRSCRSIRVEAEHAELGGGEATTPS